MSYLLKAILGISGAAVATAVVVMVTVLMVNDKYLPQSIKLTTLRVCGVIVFIWMIQVLCHIYYSVYSFLVR